MASTLYSVYRRAKGIPVLGRILIILRDAWHHPALVRWRLFRGDRRAAHELLARFFPDDPVVHKLLEDFVATEVFQQKYSVGHSGDFDIMALYALVRAVKPTVVVETGVASGRSSSAILAALAANGTGHLYSIDLPQYYEGDNPETYTTVEGNTELRGFVPKGKEPGWLVPNELRDRWTLILGDSNVELPKLLAEHPVIDIFYHDGDHSYPSMSFEFRSAWDKMSDRGFLLSDDIKWNSAWAEFVEAHPHCQTTNYRNFGVMCKVA